MKRVPAFPCSLSDPDATVGSSVSQLRRSTLSLFNVDTDATFHLDSCLRLTIHVQYTAFPTSFPICDPLAVDALDEQ
jgi:hypothetical protein